VTFQNPLFLALFVVLIPIVYFIWKGYQKEKHNLKYFYVNNSNGLKRSLFNLTLSVLLISSLLIAAAGPQRLITTPQGQVSGNFVFLIDVSRSMAARDSCDESMRIENAKSLVSKITSEIPMARFAIVPFSELAFPFTELSFNQQTIMDVIQNSLVIEAVPVPGSDIGNALLVIVEKKKDAPQMYELVDHIILLSDGDISDAAVQRLDEVVPVLKEAKVQVISVGIGSSIGLPIPVIENNQCVPGMYERSDGREYYTHLVERPLRFIAEQTGGRYFSEADSNEIVDYLKSSLTYMAEQEIPIKKEDMDYIFLLVGTFSLIGLAWMQRT